MSFPRLLPRQHQVLKAIHDYIKKFDAPPHRTNKWLCDETGHTSNHITNIKSDLKRFGYLDEDTSLTKNGWEYIRFYFDVFAVESVELRVQGKVLASPAQEDVQVNYDDLDVPNDDTISIPQVKDGKDYFALEVDGPSMEEVGILNGDFVIVERQNDWWPNPQDVVIARYLPHDPNRDAEENVDPDDYVGPTIKVYRQRFGENGCELGWRKHNDQNPYVIKADDLKPIGKVVGVYRKVNNILPNL